MDSSTGAANTSLIHDLLDEAATEAPNAAAVRDEVGVWTYGQLAEMSRAFGAWLDSKHVRRGDRLMVQMPSRRETVAMFYGAIRRGVVFVPINPAMKAFHIKSVLASAEPALIVAAGDQVGQLRDLAAVEVHGVVEIWPEVASLAASGAMMPSAGVQPADVAVLIYTSGSTAAPKGVIGPHAHFVFASRAIVEVLGYRPDDVVFCRFPLSWDVGLYKVVLACLGRSEIILADREADLRLLKRMRETGVTVVPMLPSLASMIVSLARRSPADLPPVRLFTNSGEMLPAATIDALRELFPDARIVRQYGLTECKRVSIMPPRQDEERPDSVGLPLPGTTVRILSSDGQPLPPGEVGEIVVSGPHVMPGYWRDPTQTAQTFRLDPETGERRLHTGDYGRLDADGYLYFQGRRDDIFKRKGIRMSTIEIEAAALDVPGVRAAVAVPPAAEHDLTIIIEGALEPRAVLRAMAARLEPAKVPTVCRVVPAIPLTRHGKSARQDLVALVEETGSIESEAGRPAPASGAP